MHPSELRLSDPGRFSVLYISLFSRFTHSAQWENVWRGLAQCYDSGVNFGAQLSSGNPGVK